MKQLAKLSASKKQKSKSVIGIALPAALLIIPAFYYLVVCDTFFGKYNFQYNDTTMERLDVYSNNTAIHYYFDDSGSIVNKSKETWFRTRNTVDGVVNDWFILVPSKNSELTQQNMLIKNGDIVDQTICYKYSNEGLYRSYQK